MSAQLALGSRAGRDTEWAERVVVAKDGRVYYAMTGPNGMKIDEFKKQWEHADAIDFGF